MEQRGAAHVGRGKASSSHWIPPQGQNFCSDGLEQRAIPNCRPCSAPPTLTPCRCHYCSGPWCTWAVCVWSVNSW